MSGVLNLLCFELGTDWVPIPEWAMFFIRIGEALSKREVGDVRTVTVLVVPTRSYCSALAALGVVVTRSTVSTKCDNLDVHFQQLCSLDNGTPLLFVRGARKWNAVFDGCEDYRDEPHIRVRLEKKICRGRKAGGRRELVPKERSMSITLRDGGDILLPTRQKGRLLTSSAAFLQKLLHTETPTEFVMNKRLECTLVGAIGLLRYEVNEPQFAVGIPQSSDEAGTIQDVIRVQQFQADGSPFRTVVFKALGGHGPDLRGYNTPHVAIFDGATAFVQWRHLFDSSHVISILDRSDHNFQDAVDAANYDYIRNRLRDIELPYMDSLPKGVEVVMYEEEISEKNRI